MRKKSAIAKHTGKSFTLFIAQSNTNSENYINREKRDYHR